MVENWQKQHPIKTISVGASETADIYISDINQKGIETGFKLNFSHAFVFY